MHRVVTEIDNAVHPKNRTYDQLKKQALGFINKFKQHGGQGGVLILSGPDLIELSDLIGYLSVGRDLYREALDAAVTRDSPGKPSNLEHSS